GVCIHAAVCRSSLETVSHGSEPGLSRNAACNAARQPALGQIAMTRMSCASANSSGPFHGGVGVAVWLNEVQTDAGPKFFRSVSVQPRRYRDKKTGEWKDAASFRPTDLPALMLGLEAAMSFIAHTPLPGQSIDDEDQLDALADRDGP